jgi:hypothetical protein
MAKLRNPRQLADRLIACEDCSPYWRPVHAWCRSPILGLSGWELDCHTSLTGALQVRRHLRLKGCNTRLSAISTAGSELGPIQPRDATELIDEPKREWSVGRRYWPWSRGYGASSP